MKQILFIALLGIAPLASFAQDKEDCFCGDHGKQAAPKRAVIHHTTTTLKKTSAISRTSTATTVASNRNVKRADAPCYMYRKHNIVVTECPGLMFDDEGNMDLNSESTYMGYYPIHHYPRKSTEQQNNAVNAPMAPEHTTINRNRGIAPADGNACNQNCTPQ